MVQTGYHLKLTSFDPNWITILLHFFSVAMITAKTIKVIRGYNKSECEIQLND